MGSKAEVVKLTDGAHAELMTEWMYGWWGRRENYPREAVREYVLHSLSEKRLPQTYGLFAEGRLAGMYQFTNGDLFVRPDIYPWLANVYLDERFRGMGLGRVLLESVRGNAAEAGLDELYLYTAHTGLYEKFGWEYAGELDTFLEPRVQRLYRLDVRRG
jgi:GNAT superfamily N-acetyltransferase